MANLKIKLWTYRQGGSMICDERVYHLTTYPEREDLQKLLTFYTDEVDYDGDVMFEIFGISRGVTN